MKNMLKRLFIQLPLYIIFFVAIVSIIIPIGYWIITGNNPIDDFLEYIENI